MDTDFVKEADCRVRTMVMAADIKEIKTDVKTLLKTTRGGNYGRD